MASRAQGSTLLGELPHTPPLTKGKKRQKATVYWLVSDSIATGVELQGVGVKWKEPNQQSTEREIPPTTSGSGFWCW